MSSYLVQFQVNIFSLAILVGLLLFLKMSKVQSFSKRIIRYAIIATGISIVMEPLTWIFDSEQFFGAYLLEYWTNFILVLMAPIIGGFLIAYVDFRIHNNTDRIKSRFYYQHITIVTFMILLVNFFNPIYFSVNPISNRYHVGDYFFVHYLLFFSLYFHVLFLTIKYRKNVSLRDLMIYLSIFLIPITGAIIQLVESHFYLSWSSVVFVLFILYLFMETTPVEEDHLTRTYNRESLHTHIENLIQSQSEFGMILLDLDDFKACNDKYGHKKGDDILIAFSEALKFVYKNTGFVARLGGDEFCVVIETGFDDFPARLEQVKEVVSLNIDEVIAKMSFSYGFQKYEPDMKIDDLYVSSDRKMYENKRKSKI